MNLFDLFVRIGVKDEASDKLSGIAGSLGGGLKAAASVGVAAISVAASGIAALTTAAVKNYAEYEQLVGGVDTLFKESSGKVQQYASEAYKTAGLSANEYMSTVTSVSASLLQSLGGDTEAAADLADRALRDMSDNANKMGTDMQTIIGTYQSLSRGNYAMLDNLKLGFGGTKAEMERLIATAAELDSSVKANDMSFGNMVKAIGVIQDEMGITGTTALEASTTISGSVASMKAAWQNLLVGVADDTADFDSLVNNFVESVGTAAQNVLPRVTAALNGAAQLVTQLLPVVFEALPQIVSDVLPQMAEAAVNIIQALITGISENKETLMTSAMDVIMVLVNGIITLLPQIIDVGLQLIVALAQGLASAAPTLVPAVVDCIYMILDVLIQNAPLLLSAGLELISQLLIGLVNAFPSVVSWVTSLPEKLVKLLIEHAPTLLNAGMTLVENISNGFVIAWNSFSMIVKGLINDFLNLIGQAVGAVGDWLGMDWNINMPQISTEFEEDKISGARKAMGLGGGTTNINISAVQQTPGQIANAVSGALAVSRW